MTCRNAPLACSMPECPSGLSQGPPTSTLQQWAVLDIDLRSLAWQQTVHMLDDLVWLNLPRSAISGFSTSSIALDQPRPLQMRQSVYSIDGFLLKLSEIDWRKPISACVALDVVGRHIRRTLGHWREEGALQCRATFPALQSRWAAVCVAPLRVAECWRHRRMQGGTRRRRRSGLGGNIPRASHVLVGNQIRW